MTRLSCLLVCGVALLACTRATEPAPVTPPPAPPAPLKPPPDVALGRQLFHRGEGKGGVQLRGYIGEERVELPGRAAACANCHDHDGRGTKEGGVAAPDITARALFAPRQGDKDRARPAYDDRTLAEALTRGHTPTGRALHIAMPRFGLEDAERDALVGYLHRLGEEKTPGVDEDVLRVGALLPLRGPLAEVGEDVRGVLQATFADINAQGGLYRRRLELVVEDETQPAGASRLLASGVLALVGAPSGAAQSPALREALDGVPVLAPLGTPEEAAGEGPVFFLYPGPEVQARVAVRHLEERKLHGRWAVVAAQTPEGTRWAEGARAEAARRQQPAPVEYLYAPGGMEPAAALAALRGAKAQAVLFHGTREELLALLAAQQAAKDKTPLLAPVYLAKEGSGEAPPAGMERVSFVCPTLVGEELHARGQDFFAFLTRHTLQPRHLGFQMSAYATARVLEDALKRAGAAVTREGLLSALEGTRELETLVTPPITFGTNRRVGIQGASLVRWSPKARRLEQVSAWLEAGP